MPFDVDQSYLLVSLGIPISFDIYTLLMFSYAYRYDEKMTIENCDPIVGIAVDHVVTWKGKSLGSSWINGALSFVFQIPDDATAFAFSV